MPKDQIKITDVSGSITAGGNPVFTLKGGFRYHELGIVGSGTAQTLTSVLTAARLKYGAKIQRNHTVTELDDHNKLWGSIYGVQNNGSGGPFSLPVMFWEPYRKQYVATERYSLDVLQGEEVQLEVDIASGATSPTLKLVAVVEDLENIPVELRNRTRDQSRPVFCKWRKREGIAFAASTLDLNDMPMNGRYGLISLYNPAGTTISEVLIQKDGKTIFDYTKVQQDSLLTRNGMTPVAGRFDIVPEISDNPTDLWNLDGAKKFEIKITCAGTPSAGATLKVISQVYGTPD